MGGHGPELLKHDPALERWQTMREKAHEHFRPTPRNMRTGFIAFVLIPAIAFYVADKTFNKVDLFARKYNESTCKEECNKKSE